MTLFEYFEIFINLLSRYDLILNAPVDYPDWFSEDAASFVSQLLIRDPKLRITPKQMKVLLVFFKISFFK